MNFFTDSLKVVPVGFMVGWGLDLLQKEESEKFRTASTLTSIALLALSRLIGKNAAMGATLGIFLLTKSFFENSESGTRKYYIGTAIIGSALFHSLANPAVSTIFSNIKTSR
ncbi:MAG: hypothetical protein LVR00_02215 [Rhabdochlamydiaceae bacterium]|jgi:hypothetical protein